MRVSLVSLDPSSLHKLEPPFSGKPDMSGYQNVHKIICVRIFFVKSFRWSKEIFEEALTFSCPLGYLLPALPTTVWRMKPEQRERLGDYSLEKKHVFSKAVKYIYSEANWNTPPHKCIWNQGAPWQICTAMTECIWLYSRNTLYRSPTNLRKFVVLSKKEEIQNFKTKFEVGVIGKSTSL